MAKNALKIDASSESQWFGWPQKKVLPNGENLRSLSGGESRVLEINGNRKQKSFVAIQFAEDIAPDDAKYLRAKWDGRTLEAFFNPIFPRFAFFCPTALSEGSIYGPIRFELEYSVSQSNSSKPNLQISTVYYLPARGMFSKVWASRQRQAIAKKAGGKPEWSPEDFPYSHFDGTAFLLNNESVRKSIQDAEFASAIEYFYKNASHLKSSLVLAVDTSPQPGSLSNIIGHALQVPDLKKTILDQKDELIQTRDLLNLQKAKSRFEIDQASTQRRDLEEENKLLLKQLHSVQEEFEKVFIESKNFKSLKKELEAVKVEAAEMETKLADGAVQFDACTQERDALNTEKQALDARLSALESENKALVFEREALQKDLAAAMQGTSETEKKRAEIAALLDARTQERDAHLAEHEFIQNELQKTLLECSRKNKEIQTLSAECKELKNRTLEFEKKQSELVIQWQKSVTEREALQKDLAAAVQGTADTEKKRADLAAQLEARTKERDVLGTERDELKKDLEASKAQAAETEKGRADLAAQLEARMKERDSLGNERDQLNRTAGERASRIAELEAQVADQAERQKLIDEQMVRAESQLEMLKQFLQPAFQ